MKHLRAGLRQYGPLLQNPDFQRVLLAGLISSIGSKISYFALLRKVYIISGDHITDLGFLAIVQLLPGVIVGPVAGILVDRFARKWIMVLCDLVNAVVILSLIFAHDLWFVYVVAALSSTITTFRFPAQRALEPNLVKRSEIVLLNSFRASTQGLIQVVGSAIGGTTVGLLGARLAFMVDAATFLISAGFILTLRTRETHFETTAGDGPDLAGTRRRLWSEFREGVVVLAQNVNVRIVFLIEMLMTLGMSMQAMLIYYFLRQTLQLGNRAEAFWGYLLSMLGVGSIVGSLVLGVLLSGYPNRIKLFLNVLLVDAAALVAFLFNRFLPLSLGLFAILGVISSAHQIIMNTILQEEVSDRKRGRLFSLLGVAAGPLSAASIFIGTVAAEHLTAQVVLLASASIEALIAVGVRFTASYQKATANQEQATTTNA